MKQNFFLRFLGFQSDNRQSKIQNLKWVGLFAIVVALTVCGARAEAQQQGKIFRIGVLDNTTASGSAVRLQAFWQEVRKLGWIEGKNIAIEYRFSEAKSGRLPELVADLVRLLEVLKNAVPKLARVGLPRAGGSSGISRSLQLENLRPAAVALKLKLEEIETQPDAKGLESFKQKQVGAIMIGAGPIYFTERKRIVELAVKYRLPAIYPQKEYVDEGGLMYYGIDSVDLLRRAAYYVDKILKGAKPADLPVQQATKFDFIINLKAAKQIDLTIPNRVLERANQVIK